MYLPKSFREEDKSKQIDFIKNNNFAVLVSSRDEQLEASHIPLYFQTVGGKEYLLGHMAKANNHLKILSGSALAIFSGPHAYVSEKWYEAFNVVPTWNYVAVHVKGKVSLTDDQGLKDIIEMMVKNHEGDFQTFKNNIDDSFYSSLLTQIVGFRIEIESIEGKWKLSQNRSLDAQQKIANQLSKQKDYQANLISNLMNQYIKSEKNGPK